MLKMRCLIILISFFVFLSKVLPGTVHDFVHPKMKILSVTKIKKLKYNNIQLLTA